MVDSLPLAATRPCFARFVDPITFRRLLDTLDGLLIIAG